MKSLDDQVDAASDGVAPVRQAAEPAVVPPFAGAPRRPQRRRTGWVVSSILLAVAVAIGHLVVDGVRNRANENAAIARINPTSMYNSKLSAAITSRESRVKPAEQKLTRAAYLQTTTDYANLDWALADTQSTIALYRADLLDAVTRHQYEAAVADLDKSIDQLQTARAVVEGDVAATPAPTTPTATS